MKTGAIASILLLMATPALAQSTNEQNAVSSTDAMPLKAEDFAQRAAAGDMFEIQSSQLAVDRTDGATKAFAQKMIDDHQKTTSQLKDLVSSGQVKVNLPNSMEKEQQDMLDKLRSLDGNDFTQQYQKDQVTAHEQAVQLFQQYGQNGDNQELSQWAQKTLPTLQDHLDMAKGLQNGG